MNSTTINQTKCGGKSPHDLTMIMEKVCA